MGDSIFIFLLALMLFGPKKLPQLARQLGKLMAEFRKASNDFRMQMEDELRLEEQKEHQAKVAALSPPPSTVASADVPTEEPPHPHLPAPMPAEDVAAEPVAVQSAGEQPIAVQPIAESGDLKMMPPSTGLPTESSGRARSYPDSGSIPEHSIGGGLATAEPDTAFGAGTSSEEPLAELEPPPDRSQPVMAGQGERATHA